MTIGHVAIRANGDAQALQRPHRRRPAPPPRRRAPIAPLLEQLRRPLIWEYSGFLIFNQDVRTTGSVRLFVDGITAGTGSLTTTGAVTIVVPGLTVGTHSVVAEYLGDTAAGLAASTSGAATVVSR